MKERINIVKYFKNIEDYRNYPNMIDHKLINIIIISVCAIFCGADGYSEIHAFAELKKEYFIKTLCLEKGIPSESTFKRMFSFMDPKIFKEAFSMLINDICDMRKEKFKPIDGKALRGANNKGENPIYLVSAWAKESGLVLASSKVEKKSNEITAIPEVLRMIDINGCIVTIDAMGCQEKIVEQIIEQKGGYVISLKGNQGKTKDYVEDFFHGALKLGFNDIKYDYYETIEKSHGRIERREYYITDDLSYIDTKDKWKGLRSIGMVISTVERDGKKTTDIRYHICSILADAKEYAEAVRAHWSIENNFHWVMDVTFREDKSRIRKDNSPENMAIIRRFVMNILKKTESIKGSIRIKQKTLSWDVDNALNLLFGKV